MKEVKKVDLGKNRLGFLIVANCNYLIWPTLCIHVEIHCVCLCFLIVYCEFNWSCD